MSQFRNHFNIKGSALAWIESKTRLIGHPGLFELARILGIPKVQALGHLVMLWNVIAVYDEKHLTSLSPDYVAEISLWEGDPEAFFSALVRCGWITRAGNINFQDCAHIVHGATTRTGRYAWRVLRLKILNRDNFTCRYCGARNPLMSVDHVVAVTKGGTDEESNLVAACQSCNAKKNNKPLKVFLDALNKS